MIYLGLDSKKAGYYDVFGWVDKFGRQGVSLGKKRAEHNKNDVCFFGCRFRNRHYKS